MIVREAIESDIPRLSDLLGILFSQEAEFQPDSHRQIAGLKRVVGYPDVGRILVLQNGEQIIGMVSLLFLPSTALGGITAFLEDMIVSPTHRGSGAGAKLLDSAIECARAAGCLRITLLTDGLNVRAQQFYLRAGFATSSMLPMRLLLLP
jgi:GNAT superfamily N-acetyltransferase